MSHPNFLPTKDYLCNFVINRIPYHDVRMKAYRHLGLNIGRDSTILMSTEVHRALDVRIGENTIINHGVFEIDKAGRILVVWPAACSMENNDGESYPIFIANSIIPA